MRQLRFLYSAVLFTAALASLCAADLKSWRPAPDSMLTAWGEQLTPETAWREYPRPALARTAWVNLNGLWQYAVTPLADATPPAQWTGDILVPFAIESALSGVKRRLTASDALWYRRSFAAPSAAARQRTLLNFEAVDYQATVWVNDTKVGTHTGGNLPFGFDITSALRAGENTLTVRVTDATDAAGAYQLHGKQVANPGGIWYTPVTGIWQTVWLETVPEAHIAALNVVTKIDGSITIDITPGGSPGGKVPARVTVSLQGKPVATAQSDTHRLTLSIPNPQLWSPDSPTLYDLAITYGSDSVSSYLGLRETTVIKDADGHLRLALNGKSIFHFGPLDQGWWPDGLLTPPSDAGMRSDLEFLKAAGFNMLRKHIKVEPRRYYLHCDRIGLMVWQDQVSTGTGKKRATNDSSAQWTRLAPNPVDAIWPDAAHAQFMAELKGMVDSLRSHPCIVQWVPFNEAWGQHRTVEVSQWLVAYDPTRQVNAASGGNFYPAGHIVDAHNYPHPSFPFAQGAGGRFEGFVKVMGEYGGHGFPVQGHLWNPNARNWGYGGLPKDKDEWIERYRTSLRNLADLKTRGISAGIYTQTTDVEGEINGLITYDRNVRKLAPEVLAAFHREAGIIPAAADTVVLPPIAPAMVRVEIEAGLKSHDRALYIKQGWIRDPYLKLAPDGFYYLTGTTAADRDARELADAFNSGLGPKSTVGPAVRVWRSKDLVDWEYLGTPYTLEDSWQKASGADPGKLIWAPELHWLGDRWALVHCPGPKANLALSAGAELKGPWTHPMGDKLGTKHDPSLFQDGDTWWMLWQNTLIAPLSRDFTQFTAEPVRIDPSGRRPGPDGKPISRIGHEGATMMKVGGKYVHLGTAWSTDQPRKGSYNLYYCVADKITGPYGPRKFAGRFLGHGTPFQSRDGQWWCTAFYNANVPPLPRAGIESRHLAQDAQTINPRGTTIVPLDVRVLPDGDIHIRAKDPAYATPGPDEAQKFSL
jgi:hypothetical protein